MRLVNIDTELKCLFLEFRVSPFDRTDPVQSLPRLLSKTLKPGTLCGGQSRGPSTVYLPV